MKSGVIYMGLFLMSFGLYAHERTLKANPAPILAREDAPAINEAKAPLYKLDRLFRELSAEALFKKK